jgi:hypothetical protein
MIIIIIIIITLEQAQVQRLAGETDHVCSFVAFLFFLPQDVFLHRQHLRFLALLPPYSLLLQWLDCISKTQQYMTGKMTAVTPRHDALYFILFEMFFVADMKMMISDCAQHSPTTCKHWLMRDVRRLQAMSLSPKAPYFPRFLIDTADAFDVARKALKRMEQVV